MVAVLGYQAINYFVGGKEPRRMGNAHPNIVPYDVFPVADGDIIIATGNDGQYRKLCDVLGVSELADDPRFATSKDRTTNRAVVQRNVLSDLRAASRAPSCCRNSMPPACPRGRSTLCATCSPIRRSSIAACEIETPNPKAKSGATPGLRSPLIIDGEATASPRPAPALGEHTDEVLSDRNWGGQV